MAMDKKLLVINPGSKSKKYAFYLGRKQKLTAHFETEDGKKVVTFKACGLETKHNVSPNAFNQATEYLIDHLCHIGHLKSHNDLDAIGLRIVAPGTYFQKNRLINHVFLRHLVHVKTHAPLHINPILEEIHHLHSTMPSRTKLVGISDSTFHSTLPDHARFYAIKASDSKKYDIHRFGYHGISIQSILRQVDRPLPKRIIVCHLGGGASLTAVKYGQSIDTSMGMTPLEGLTMSTRVGDIDPGALVHLFKKKGKNIKNLEKYLNKQTGLLGISRKTSDIRQLLQLERESNKDAKLALKIFIYKIQKYIGAYTAALNGLDLLIFSATIGERSDIIRSRVCTNLDYLGLDLDTNKNKHTNSSWGYIHSSKSKVKVAVIPTQELAEIAYQTLSLLK